MAPTPPGTRAAWRDQLDTAKAELDQLPAVPAIVHTLTGDLLVALQDLEERVRNLELR